MSKIKKLAFGLILGGTLYAPVEITRCVLRDMPYVSDTMVNNFRIELVWMWSFYIMAISILAITLFRTKYDYKRPQN